MQLPPVSLHHRNGGHKLDFREQWRRIWLHPDPQKLRDTTILNEEYDPEAVAHSRQKQRKLVDGQEEQEEEGDGNSHLKAEQLD
jgi:hypothetical protein